MTCKSHPVESGAGVCATCLRERLNSVAADTEPLEEPHPIPCSTPAAGLARPSLLSVFFARRGHIRALGEEGGEGKTHKFRKSASWLSALLNRRRRKKKLSGPASADAAAAVVSDRGMTPEDHSPRRLNPPMSHMMMAIAGSDVVISPESGRPDDESPRRLPSSHKKRTTSESYWRMSPRRVSESSAPPLLMKPLPARRSATERPGGELAGFALCFRPLVTANPARRNFQMAGIGFSGDTTRVSPLGPPQRRRASTG